jgi:hypothetical protein
MNKWECIKPEFLHSKRNNHQTQETAHSIGENFCQLLIQKGSNIQKQQVTQKIQPPKVKYPETPRNSKNSAPKQSIPNKEMDTWIKKGILKGRSTNGQ